MKKYFVLMHD